MLKVYPFVILGTYTFNLLTSGITLMLNVVILCIIRRTPAFDISLSLYIYIFTILFSSIFMYIESCFEIGWWRYDVDYSLNLMFWFGLINHSLLTNVPSAIFFMSLDRCLVIIYKCKYRQKWSQIIGRSSLITVITLTASVLIINLVTRVSVVTQTMKPCIHFACTMNQTSKLIYNGSVIFISALNVAVGICYLIASKRYQKSVITVNSDFFLSDLLTARALIFAFIFHFLPHTILIFYVAIANDTPLTNYGSYSRTLLCADCFCSSFVNIWLVIRKHGSLDRRNIPVYCNRDIWRESSN